MRVEFIYLFIRTIFIVSEKHLEATAAYVTGSTKIKKVTWHKSTFGYSHT